MKVLIRNCGCHDDTETEMELTEKELEFLIKFAKENNKNSSYGCQPEIAIFKKYSINVNGYFEYNNDDDLLEIKEIE